MKIRIGKNDLPSLHDNDGSGGRSCNTTSAFALPICRTGRHGSPVHLPGLFELAVVTPGSPGVTMRTPSPPVCPVVNAGPSVLPMEQTVLPQPHVLFCESVNANDSNDSHDSDDDEDFEVQQAVIAELSLSPDIDPELDNGNEFCTTDAIIEEEDEDIDVELPDSTLEEKIDSPSFLETDNLSMKIVSFPHLKETIETNICCKICMLE